MPQDHPPAGRSSAHALKRRRVRLGLLLLALACCLAALLALYETTRAPTHNRTRPPSAPATAYGWPVKPFDRQHPIGANFDDPRMANKHISGPGRHDFHFGVDIVAPDGTPVYAVETGEVRFHDPTAVVVAKPRRGAEAPIVFGYWHIRPVVRDRQMVAKHQLLGYIEKGAGHVHFAEERNGRYVNPLRTGGLTPYVDHTRPTIRWLKIYKDSKYHSLDDLGRGPSGRINLVVSAFDTPSIPSVRWPRSTLTPAFISWSLTNKRGETVLKRAVVDFDRLYTEPLMAVYAPGTVQNGPHQAGVYNFWLARNWDTARLPGGSYVLTVTASTIQGNRTSKSFNLEILH